LEFHQRDAADGQEVGRSPLLVIFITVFIDLLGFGIILPMLPFYAQDFGATGTMVGLLFASYSLMQFLFAPVWGRVSDALGRRPILLISLLGTAISFTIFGLARTLLVLFIGRIAAGIFGAVITTAFAFIADVTTPENRARGMGLVGAAFGLGFIFGPPLGGLVANAFGLAAPAFLAAALALANFVLAWFVLPESYPRERRIRSDLKTNIRQTFRFERFWEALHHPEVGALLFLQFLLTLAFANMEATYALLTQWLYDWGSLESGYAFLYIGLIIVVVQGGMIRPLTRRFGEHKLMVAGSILVVPGLGLLPFSPGLAAFLLLSGALALGSGLYNPSLNSLISKGVGPDEQGGIMGINMSLASLARVLGPVWGGFTFERIGPSAPYWTGAIMMLVCVGIALTLLRRYGKQGSAMIGVPTPSEEHDGAA
jgi:DHA1 family tetracycline resistance protein-like MFS transporter